MASWTNGKWEYENDTLTLEPIFVYDTLVLIDENRNFVKDSIVLSIDSKSQKISYTEYAQTQLISTKQNQIIPPSKLFYKKSKLIGVKENGKLIKKKVRGFSTKKRNIDLGM